MSYELQSQHLARSENALCRKLVVAGSPLTCVVKMPQAPGARCESNTTLQVGCSVNHMFSEK